MSSSAAGLDSVTLSLVSVASDALVCVGVGVDVGLDVVELPDWLELEPHAATPAKTARAAAAAPHRRSRRAGAE